MIVQAFLHVCAFHSALWFSCGFDVTKRVHHLHEILV